MSISCSDSDFSSLNIKQQKSSKSKKKSEKQNLSYMSQKSARGQRYYQDQNKSERHSNGFQSNRIMI